MAEFYVSRNTDSKIGDTWFSSGVFGLNIGGSMNIPEPCTICGAPATTCIGDNHGTAIDGATSEDDSAYPEAA